MTQTRLLLVVSESGGITNEARNARRVTYQAVADKIGAELLVTAEGCGAQLLEVPQPASVPAVMEPGQPGVPVMRYSEKTTEAFRVVESLLNQDLVKLVRDRWSHGALRFLSPSVRQPSALLSDDLGGISPVPADEPSHFRRVLRWGLPLSLLGWGIVAGLVWLVRPLSA
ncbi:hypothetical protein D3C76_1214530 [compost metagenome]